MHRSKLLNAPYNPRFQDIHSRKKLKDGLKRDGLAGPIIWNRRTGNIIGGHQRIGIMDELEGSADYLLDVAVMDLDDVHERELNVRLNNQNMAGNWDYELLTQVMQTPEIDLTALGFDNIDIQAILGDGPNAPIFDDANEPAKPEIEQLESLRSRRHEYKKAQRSEDDPEFFLILVFDDRKGCEAFAAALGQPTDRRYLSGPRVAGLLGIDLDGQASPPTGEAGQAEASPDVPAQTQENT